MIAPGTHHTAYYTYEHEDLQLSRFADAHVRKHHRVVPMLGPRGGGFLFDSNALHKIEMEGSVSRQAVVLEWHAHHKVPALATFNAPCPSRRRNPRERRNRAVWMDGLHGYPLYPPEAASLPPPATTASEAKAKRQR